MVSGNIYRGHAHRTAFGTLVLIGLLFVGTSIAQIPPPSSGGGGGGVGAINISSCTTISEPGTYVLNTSILDSSASSCIDIVSNDVIFDGAGYTIDGVDAWITYGVYVYNSTMALTNVTVKNLIVIDWGSGIYYKNAAGGSIINNIANSNQNSGIELFDSSNHILTNNTANSNRYGISLAFTSYYNTLTNNAVKENSEYDIYPSLSVCNNIIESNMGSGGRPIKYFNNSVNLQNENLSELILCNAGNSNVKNVTIEGSATKYNNGLLIIRTDNSNFTNIKSLKNFRGILLYYSTGNYLTNSIANSNLMGIQFENSNSNYLTNNNAESNDYGISLFSSNINTLTNNNVNNSQTVGFFLASSISNILTNNIASNNPYGMYLTLSSNNTIYNNYFNNTNNAFDNGNNIWNITNTSGINIIGGPFLGGNFWANPSGTGFSQTCVDRDIDGICDSPYEIDSSNIDYLPLTVPAAPPTGAPAIISFSPLTSTVMDNVGVTRTFNIIINQTVNVSWQINGTEVFNETGVTKSSYTNTSASRGTWIVNVTATNANGMISHEWTWTVAYGGVVVNLGQPIPGKSNIWALTTGVDGKIYGGTGEGGTLFVYDPINNISEPLGGVSGEDAVYSLATDEKGLIYGGTAWNSKFFVYDPLNKSITYLGQPIENGGIICGLAAIGSDIYGSTCDGGDSTYAGSHLFVYNSTARIFTDLGQSVEGERGSKISIGKDGIVYGGTSPNGYLFAYDTLSKAFTIIDQPVQGEGTAFPIIAGEDGKIYFSLNGSLYVFDPATSKIDNLLELGRFIPVSGEFFWSLTEGMDGNIYGGTAPNGYLLAYNTSDGSVAAQRPLDSEYRIRSLITGIDGKIYGGTGWGAYLFSYDSGYSPSGEIKGDVNRNGRRDTGDATLILRSIVGLSIPSQYLPILPTGDMNCNNRIDAGDATLVLRDVVGLSIPRCWE